MQRITSTIALLLAASCASIDEAPPPADLLGGVATFAGSGTRTSAQPTAGLESEVAVPGLPYLTAPTGVVGSYGSDDDLAFQGQAVDVDVESWSLHAGLRLTAPEGPRVRPFLGAGLAWQSMAFEGAGAVEEGSGLGWYAEAGLRAGAFSARWRRLGGVEVGHVGDVEQDQFLLGFSASF